MKKTKIIIIDDHLPHDDPLVVELSMEEFDVKLFTDPKEGLEYVLSNLKKRMVIVLDIDLGNPSLDGHFLLNEIRKQSFLIPVILWSAIDRGSNDFSDFINNHALFYVPKSASVDEIIKRVNQAAVMLKTDLATAIEDWLEVREDKEQVLTYSGNGKSYTANDLIKEIREQSEDGVQIQEKIMKLSIDLLFRNCERI